MHNLNGMDSMILAMNHTSLLSAFTTSSPLLGVLIAEHVPFVDPSCSPLMQSKIIINQHIVLFQICRVALWSFL